MSTDFRFRVDPTEAPEERDRRWDEELLTLQATGYTIRGSGPDGDYPFFYEYPDGKRISETTEPLDGPFVEVYETVPLVSTPPTRKYLKPLPQAVGAVLTGIGVMAAFQSILSVTAYGVPGVIG